MELLQSYFLNFNNAFIPVPLAHPQNQEHLNWTQLDLTFAEKFWKSSTKKENTFVAKVVKKKKPKPTQLTGSFLYLSLHPVGLLQSPAADQKLQS